jgi:UDP-N-acetyl-D-galactosamine dehydrogenase
MYAVEKLHIAVIGLGYVGLPLAVEFGKHEATIGYDVNQQRIAELNQGTDRTLEVEPIELILATQLSYTSNADDLRSCNFFIVTVPTPIDIHKQPDMEPLKKASECLGNVINKNSIIVFESTVYPGATEEVCIPIIERESGLVFNKDFFAGYSPERINPGDKEHRLPTIKKITSGSTPEVAEFINKVYGTIITAGTHLVSSIKVAEAAKVIENTQRDVNIALINELSVIFSKMGIDTLEVLEAAGTKWNFLPFRPGLVGGHCIGVDPYYLTHKAQAIGYNPEMILSGRRINDGMGPYVAETVMKEMTQRKIHIVDSNILILGFTFKENCPDVRNTRVIDIVHEFDTYHARVDVYDPWVDAGECENEYGIMPVQELMDNQYDAIIVAVAHREFLAMGVDAIRKLGKNKHVLFDVKHTFPKDSVDGRL